MHCKSYSHFFSKKFQHICVSFYVNFNKSLTNDIVSFEQPGPDLDLYCLLKHDFRGPRGSKFFPLRVTSVRRLELHVFVWKWYPFPLRPYLLLTFMTKTRLFKYIEDFISKNQKFSDKKLTFFIFLLKTQIVGTRYNRLAEAVLTSTHNLCF